MAKSSFATVLVGLAFTLAGCQATPEVMVKDLPPQDFSGPSLNRRPAPPRGAQPPAVAARPQTFKPVAPPAAWSGTPREWTPAGRARPWTWIVIHHSATSTGGAAAFDRMHRGKGWDELGYHFVIGNGTQSGNGQVEVGPRWSVQKHGAHCKTPDNQYNEKGIGICLVGNFDVARPSPEQMAALSKLVAHLMKTYRISPDRVVGHGEAKATDCPGRHVNLADIRRRSLQILAAAGDPVPAAAPQVAGTLLHPIDRH